MKQIKYRISYLKVKFFYPRQLGATSAAIAFYMYTSHHRHSTFLLFLIPLMPFNDIKVLTICSLYGLGSIEQSYAMTPSVEMKPHLLPNIYQPS